jgi:hypothetical protein
LDILVMFRVTERWTLCWNVQILHFCFFSKAFRRYVMYIVLKSIFHLSANKCEWRKEVDEIDAYFSAMTSCNFHLFLAFLFLAFLFLAFVRPNTLTQHSITHMYIVLDRFIFVTLEFTKCNLVCDHCNFWH